MKKECEKQGMNRIILHDDNAPIHTSLSTQMYQKELKIKRMGHPSYSPDLAPNDFWLISKLKKSMVGINFSSEYEIYHHAKKFLKSIPSKEFQDCFDKWIHRMKKCIKAKGDYFEFRKRHLKKSNQ